MVVMNGTKAVCMMDFIATNSATNALGFKIVCAIHFLGHPIVFANLYDDNRGHTLHLPLESQTTFTKL